jgi:TRAP-type C4-dicarboxylate transport system permease small subunit
MSWLRLIKRALDRSLEGLVMVVVAVLVLDVLWQVLTRFVLNHPSTWTEELAVFLLIWVSLLGAAVALNRGAHLGIDYFVGKLPARARLGTEVFVFFCVSAFSFFVMVVGGIDLVTSMLELGQTSPALHVKVGYVYLAVPVSGFFLTLYGTLGLGERIARLRIADCGLRIRPAGANPPATIPNPQSQD